MKMSLIVLFIRIGALQSSEARPICGGISDDCDGQTTKFRMREAMESDRRLRYGVTCYRFSSQFSSADKSNSYNVDTGSRIAR